MNKEECRKLNTPNWCKNHCINWEKLDCKGYFSLWL